MENYIINYIKTLIYNKISVFEAPNDSEKNGGNTDSFKLTNY